MTVTSARAPGAVLIRMCNVVRQVETAKQTRRFLDGINWQLNAGDRVAVLAENRAESYAFLACASGVHPVTSGSIEIPAHISWPMGETGAIVGRLTPRQNAEFLQKVYGLRRQYQNQMNLIRELSDLPDNFFDRPLRDLNSSMKSRFRLAISLVFEFDAYLVPALDAWNYKTKTSRTQRFREAFDAVIQNKALLVSNPDPAFQKAYCQHGVVLVDGKIAFQDELGLCQEWMARKSKKRS